LLASKPKIAVVANTAWNIINFRLGLMHALKNEGYEIVAIAPEDEYSARIESEGFTFVPLKNLSRKGTNPLKDLRLLFELKQIYSKEGIGLAMHYTIKPNIYGSFAAGLCKIKSICTVTGLGYSFLSKGWISRLARNLYKTAFNSAAVVAFQNDDDRNLFIDSKLVKKEKTLLIRGSGINCEYFCPIEKTIESDNFVFLFVGRLLLDKGIREFIIAAEKLKALYPNTVCQIVGKIDSDNPSCISNAELENALQKNIIQYFGPSDEVKDFIRNADSVVLPSYREGLPRVMLEAISMAKPIITTNAAGCRDTVIDGINGYMVEPADSESLFEAMKKMCNNNIEMLEKMGQAGRELALREFDERKVVEKYLQILDDILVNGNFK
jgi:glycosyltransferase involved in cell wall biosynthesis